MTSSEVTWKATVVSTGTISCLVSNPPKVGYR